MVPRAVRNALIAPSLAALLLVGCSDGGEPAFEPAPAHDDPGPVAREVRAAELFAPRETLPLIGTRWQVEAIRLPAPGKLPLVSGIAYTIEFDPGGKRARGHDGCATYERGYEREGETLRLAPPESIGEAPPCTLSEIAALERSVIDGLLASTATLEISGDRLALESPDGAALVLRGQRLDTIPADVGPALEPEFAPGERVPFTVLERSDGENLGARGVSVPERFADVHDERSFETLWRNAHSFDPASPVPEVRFEVGTVLAAFSPLRASFGHSIRIDAVVAGEGGPEGGALVLVTTELPGAGCAVVETPTVPYEIIAVPAILAAPRFEETVVEGEPCG